MHAVAPTHAQTQRQAGLVLLGAPNGGKVQAPEMPPTSHPGPTLGATAPNTSAIPPAAAVIAHGIHRVQRFRHAGRHLKGGRFDDGRHL